MRAEPIIARSALKHGLDEAEILHAYRNPVRIWDLGDGFTMIVGPNQSAIFLEVGYVDGEKPTSSSMPCKPARSS